jgi:NADP-dependent 3-hydroxy acid dehydrogenase YdfG
MSKSIAVFGAGPGLGQAVARRYAREGYAVTLVARRSQLLDRLAKDLTSAGAIAHVITADLSDTAATPRLAEQIRARAGNLDAFYYAPTPNTGFVSAADLTPQHAQKFMPLIFYTMLALVQEFLPHMLEQGDGAILTAQGGSTVQGLPNMSGPGPAQAAQRNYLQALHAEVAEKASTSACSTSAQPSKTAPSTPRWIRPRLRATGSGRCLPSTPNISPTCSVERMMASSFPNWWGIDFQYNAFIVVILLLAAVDGGVRLGRWVEWFRARRSARAAAATGGLAAAGVGADLAVLQDRDRDGGLAFLRLTVRADAQPAGRPASGPASAVRSHHSSGLRAAGGARPRP